jgi:hypothetical protein
MSKIDMKFKLKDLYAIKHALQKTVAQKKSEVIIFDFAGEEDLVHKHEKDIEHEENLIEYITEEIEKIRG